MASDRRWFKEEVKPSDENMPYLGFTFSLALLAESALKRARWAMMIARFTGFWDKIITSTASVPSWRRPRNDGQWSWTFYCSHREGFPEPWTNKAIQQAPNMRKSFWAQQFKKSQTNGRLVLALLAIVDPGILCRCQCNVLASVLTTYLCGCESFVASALVSLFWILIVVVIFFMIAGFVYHTAGWYKPLVW